MGSLAVSDNPYGLRPFVHAIEEKAAWTPNHTYLRYPGEDWKTKGYSTITWRQYLDSINKIAHWLDEQLGPSSSNETIAYSGPNDVRYGLIFPAVIKTNRKLLVCDGRLTGDGLKSLLNASDCKAWFSADERWTLQTAGIHDDNIKTKSFPALGWCLDASGAPDYPYNKSWEDAADEDVIVIHTSGTTGFPKPIFHNNAFWSIWEMAKVLSKQYWPTPILFDVQANKVGMCAYPPKWAAGLAYMTIMPVYGDHITVILPPDTVGLPPDLFKQVVGWNPDLQGLHSPPQLIAALWNDPATKPLVQQLYFVIYAGAPMEQALGDELCVHTRLMPLIASTETGSRFSTIAKDRKLWNSFSFVPEGPHHFVKQEGSSNATGGSDDLYELVLDRSTDGKPSYFHGAFWNHRFYKDFKSVETRELYSPVKDIDGTTRWVFRARKDDLRKLDYLAKFNATHIEEKVLHHPAVKHVLVGGEGRPVPYILIQLRDEALGTKTAVELLDDIYNETVTLLNKEDVEEISIPRETVFSAKPEKPFKINLKALVVRWEVESDYKEEIDDIYKNIRKMTRS